MKDNLKKILVDKEFYENNYSEELNNFLKNFNLEANTTDFDFDRIYIAGYNETDDWNNAYVGSLDIIFDLKGEEEIIRIVDVF